MGFLNIENIELGKDSSKIIEVTSFPDSEYTDRRTIYHVVGFNYEQAFKKDDPSEPLGAYSMKPHGETMYIGDIGDNLGKYYNPDTNDVQVVFNETSFIDMVNSPDIFDWVNKRGVYDESGWNGSPIENYDVFVYKKYNDDGTYETKVSFTRNNPELNKFETDDGYWVYANSDKGWLRLDNEDGKSTTILDVDKREPDYAAYEQRLLTIKDPVAGDFIDFKLSGSNVPDETYRIRIVEDPGIGLKGALTIIDGGTRFPVKTVNNYNIPTSESCLFQHQTDGHNIWYNIVGLTGLYPRTIDYIDLCEIPTLKLTILPYSNAYDKVEFGDGIITPWNEDRIRQFFEEPALASEKAWYISRRFLKKDSYLNRTNSRSVFTWLDSEDAGTDNGGWIIDEIDPYVGGRKWYRYHMFDIGYIPNTVDTVFEDDIIVKITKFDHYNVETYNIYKIKVWGTDYSYDIEKVETIPIEVNDGSIPEVVYSDGMIGFIIKNADYAGYHWKIRWDIIKGPTTTNVKIRNPFTNGLYEEYDQGFGLHGACNQVSSMRVIDNVNDPTTLNRRAYLGTVFASEQDSKFRLTFTNNMKAEGVIFEPSTYEITIPGYYGDMSDYDRNKITCVKIDDGYDGVLNSSSAILINPIVRARNFQELEKGFYTYELWFVHLANATRNGIDETSKMCKDFTVTFSNCVDTYATTAYYQNRVYDWRDEVLGLYDLYDLHVDSENAVFIGNSFVAAALAKETHTPNPATPFNKIEVTGNYNTPDPSNQKIYGAPISCEDPKVFAPLLNVKFAGFNKYRYTINNTYGPYHSFAPEDNLNWGYTVVEAFNDRIIEHAYVSKLVEAETDEVKLTNSYNEYVRTLQYSETITDLGADGIAKHKNWSPWEPTTTSFVLVDEYVKSIADGDPKAEYGSSSFRKSKGLIYSYDGNLLDRDSIVIKNPKTGRSQLFDQDSWVLPDSGYSLITTTGGFKLSKDGEDVEFDYDDLLNFLVYHDISIIPEGSIKLDISAMAGGVTNICIGRLTVLTPDDRLPDNLLRNGLICYNSWDSTLGSVFNEYSDNLANGPIAIYSTELDGEGNRIKLWPGTKEMTGATWEEDGVGGGAPAPLAGEEHKILNGNAKWEYGLTDSTVNNNDACSPYKLDDTDEFKACIDKYIRYTVEEVLELPDDKDAQMSKIVSFPATAHIENDAFTGDVTGIVTIEALIKKNGITARWYIEKLSDVNSGTGSSEFVDPLKVRKYTRVGYFYSDDVDNYKENLSNIGAWRFNSWDEVDDVIEGATFDKAGRGGTAPAPLANEQYKVLTGKGTWENVTLTTISKPASEGEYYTTPTNATEEIGFKAIVYDYINELYNQAILSGEQISRVATFEAHVPVPEFEASPTDQEGQIVLYTFVDGANQSISTRWYANVRIKGRDGKEYAGTLTRSGYIYHNDEITEYSNWSWTDWFVTDDTFKGANLISGGHSGLVPRPNSTDDYYGKYGAVISANTEILTSKGDWQVNPSTMYASGCITTYESTTFQEFVRLYVTPYYEEIRWTDRFKDHAKTFTFPAKIQDKNGIFLTGTCVVDLYGYGSTSLRLTTAWRFIDDWTGIEYTRTGKISISSSTSDNLLDYTKWTWTDWEKSFAGATWEDNGSIGKVPNPVATEQRKVLTGDATWKDPFIGTTVDGMWYIGTGGTNPWKFSSCIERFIIPSILNISESDKDTIKTSEVYSFPAAIDVGLTGEYINGGCIVEIVYDKTDKSARAHWKFDDAKSTDSYECDSTIADWGTDGENAKEYSNWTWTNWRKIGTTETEESNEFPVPAKFMMYQLGSSYTSHPIGRIKTDASGELTIKALMPYFPITVWAYNGSGSEEKITLDLPATTRGARLYGKVEYTNTPALTLSQYGIGYTLGITKNPDTAKFEVILFITSAVDNDIPWQPGTGARLPWPTGYKIRAVAANGTPLTTVDTSKFDRSKFTDDDWLTEIGSYNEINVYPYLPCRMWYYGSTTDLYNSCCGAADPTHYLRKFSQISYLHREKPYTVFGRSTVGTGGEFRKLCSFIINNDYEEETNTWHYIKIRFKPLKSSAYKTPTTVTVSFKMEDDFIRAVEVKYATDGDDSIFGNESDQARITIADSAFGSTTYIGSWVGGSLLIDTQVLFSYEVIDSDMDCFGGVFVDGWYSNSSSYISVQRKDWVDIAGGSAGGVQIKRLTKAEYDAITTKDPNTIYIIS